MNIVTCRTDPFKLIRNGRARALAFPDDGDTIRGLAAIIGLNTSEWRKWLKPAVVRTKGYGLDTPLSACNLFTVPNTAYVDVNHYGWAFPVAAAVMYYTQRLETRWREAGYRVVHSRWSVGKELVVAHLADPDIYAYAFVGHGATGWLVLGNDETRDWIKEAKYTPFGILEMQLIACDTDYAWQVWRKNVSGAGLLVTIQGDFSARQMNFIVHPGEGE